MLNKDAHCSYCGHAFREPGNSSSECVLCGNITYRNPVPVAAALVPIEDGLLAVRRSIEPRRGELTFPGGYVHYGESWQTAACRELHEETGLRLAEPDDLQIFEALSTSRGHIVCLFGLARPCMSDELAGFQPTDEASELVVLREPIEMAFPQDTDVAKKYFQQRIR
jgi:ADP-ribose pyrophosphatase YjhB (NUDIX family)